MRRRNIDENLLRKGPRSGDTASDIVHNMRYRHTSQTGASPKVVVGIHPPRGRPKPPGQAARTQPVALAISALAHVVAACVLLVWLQSPVPPPAVEQTVELTFEPPAEPAPQPSPETQPAETPNQPAEPAAVAPALPQEPAPPAQEPPSEPAPAPAPAPVPIAPPPPIQPEEPPKLPPKPPTVEPDERPSPPPPPPRPRSRPVARPAPATPAPPNTPVAPPSGSSPAPTEAPPAPVSDVWRQALSAWLAAHKTYPEAARRTGAEGAVTLRFTVSRSGHVLDVALVRSAGSPVLDAAAEAMLRSATLPSFPAGMPQDSITATVQIRYTLTN
jgi:protein TonB